MEETIQMIFQYGGTVIMACLFVYIFLQDRQKNDEIIQSLPELFKSLTISNNNIAESLSILKENNIRLEFKIDRNYEEMKRNEGENNKIN